MTEFAKPRIVCVLPNYDPDTGSHFFHLYELLEKAGESLDILVIAERAKTLPTGAKLRFRRQRFSFAPLRFTELFFMLLRERAHGCRFFYIHYSFFGATASAIVATLFGARSYYWNCGMPWLYRRSLAEEMVFRFVLRHNVLVTGTLALAEDYVRHYRLMRGNIRILPNWINLERFAGNVSRSGKDRFSFPLTAKIILFVHHLSRRKGADLLPEIIAEVVKSEKNAIFVVVGSGPERAKLESRIEKMGLERFVRLEGEIPHRAVASYFSAADVFLMPSEEEGFPHVLLEAQAFGVPYVASDVGAVREITPEILQAFVVPSKNIKSFAANISELLAKNALDRMRIVEAMREWVKQYDLDKVLPKFIALFL